MNRRAALKLCFATLCLLIATFAIRFLSDSAQRSATADGWNVLIIQVDTLRADRLGCYGHESARTPHLDALATSSTLFTNHFVNATYTATSVPSLLTGTYQDRHGLWFQGDTVSPDNVMLPEILSDQGYRTAAFSANPVIHPARGYTQGIKKMGNLDQQIAEKIIDRGLQWLRRNDDRQFFLWLMILDPHFPYSPPADYTDATKQYGALEDSLSWQWVNRHEELDWDKESILWGDLATEQHIARESALYDDEIAYTDAQIGRLLDYLDDAGLRENTLIIFTSDHGEEFAEHTFFCSHGHSTYDSVSRTPLIIAAPGAQPVKVDQVVRTVDITPTILDLLKVSTDTKMDGRSLAPLIRGTKQELPPAPAYITNGPIHKGFFKERPRMYLDGIEGAWRSVRTEDWKIIRIPHPEQDIIELYDMQTDPGETRNVSGENADVVAYLLETLEAIENRVPGDELRLPEQPELDSETLEMLESVGYLSN